MCGMLAYQTPAMRTRSISGRRLVVFMAGAVIAVGAVFFYFWPAFSFYRLTGSFAPINQIDTLASPVAVNGWSEAGLSLGDGRVIQLPGFAKLPETSTALTQATTGGVELAPDGRIYGLIRINHWCGNDPVRNHIARVDLADMLVYLKEGQCTTNPSDEVIQEAAPKSGGDFSQFGWNISEYLNFQSWRLWYVDRLQRGKNKGV